MTTTAQLTQNESRQSTNLLHRITTFQVLSQAIGFVCKNGRAQAIRERLNQHRGVRPEWGDPRAKHRERELYIINEVVTIIAPNDPDIQAKILELKLYENHAHWVDKEAIGHAPQSMKDRALEYVSTPDLTPAA